MKRISDGKHDKVGRDAYYTSDPKAHLALCQHLPDNFSYIEPCAGSGELIKGIQSLIPGANCVQAIEIDVNSKNNVSDTEITIGDSTKVEFKECDFIITNPPFSKEYKKVCFEIIKKSMFHAKEGAWMLLPLGWVCNKDFQFFMSHCVMVVPIGRVKWFADSPSQESSDSVWMLFTNYELPTVITERSN